jgi:hypothetical protein
MRDAHAHNARMVQEVGALKIIQSGSYGGPGCGKGGRVGTTMLFDGADPWSTAMGMTTKLPRTQAGSRGGAVCWSQTPAGSTVSGWETIDGRVR